MTLPESLALATLPGERRKHRADREIRSSSPQPALPPALPVCPVHLASHFAQEMRGTEQDPENQRGGSRDDRNPRAFALSFCQPTRVDPAWMLPELEEAPGVASSSHKMPASSCRLSFGFPG